MEGPEGVEPGGQTAAVSAASIVDTVKRVITDPAGFFREMPKEGGFMDPLIFLVAMSVVTALVGVLLSLVGLAGPGATFGAALASIIIVPIFAAIFGFVGAAILFVIWKILGSEESYETAYRCGAYMAAISPITSVLGVIPYLGLVLSAVWGLFLVVTASAEVHKIKQTTAWLVFGILTGLLCLMGVGSQCAARKMSREMAPPRAASTAPVPPPGAVTPSKRLTISTSQGKSVSEPCLTSNFIRVPIETNASRMC